jgi:hypothetical protein
LVSIFDIKVGAVFKWISILLDEKEVKKKTKMGKIL